MKGSREKLVLSLCAVAALTLLFQGCGGSSKSTAPAPAPEPAPQAQSLEMPEGHGLKSVKVSAGKSVYSRGVTVTCSTGCEANFAADGMATYKGTKPMVETNHMILAANSGPKGDSDGEHAKNLITKIGTTNTSVGLQTPIAVTKGSIVQSTMEQEPKASVEASHSADGVEMTLNLGINPARFDSPSSKGIFMIKKSAGGMIPKLEGFHGAALKQTASGGRIVYATVYSDIEEEKAEIPKKEEIFGGLDFSENKDVQAQLIGSKDRTITDMVLPDDNLVLKNIVVPEGRDWDEEVTVSIAENAGLKVTFNPYDHDNDKGKETPALTEGFLQCVTGPCESQQANTNVAKLRGTWRIVVVTEPKKDAVPDMEYLKFGVWLASPNLPSGPQELGAFANGNGNALKKTELAVLKGKATYTGPATGVYARGDYPPTTSSHAGRKQNPEVKNPRIGSFVAEATLKADFDIAGTAPKSVSGMVSNFMENGEKLGRHSNDDWFVELKDTEGLTNNEDMLFTGKTGGAADGILLKGQWGVKLFKDGNEKKTDDAKTKMIDETHPGYATGTFSASTIDEDLPVTLEALHIIGSFGTSKTENK